MNKFGTDITLRDFFAAVAMHTELLRLKDSMKDPDCDFNDWHQVQEYAALRAYDMADIMLDKATGAQ